MQGVAGVLPGKAFSPRMPLREHNFLCPVRCAGASLVTLAEEDKYYYREVKDFVAEYNASAPGDFYELLGVDADADHSTIRKAFREKQRVVHPDIAGHFSAPMQGRPQISIVGDAAVDLAVLLNKAYETLMDPALRLPYDKELSAFRSLHGAYDGKPISTWGGGDHEQRAIFVDETTCIGLPTNTVNNLKAVSLGCRNCTGCAPSTFFMEDDFGRARVARQWGDDEEWVREAMDMCPVDCIYFVQKKQVALLEFVMKSCKREDTVILARRRSGNMGSAPSKENPFTKAAEFMKKRIYAQMSAFQEGRPKFWMQDEELAAAIAKAWLQLPTKLRIKGWPAWDAETDTV